MKNYFKRLPMRIKLIVSFSGPMILIFILLLSCSYMLIEKRYEAQIIYSADQSFEQAVNFLESHLQNMNYILELVGADRELQDMLEEGNYLTRQEAGDQWRDYWRINDIMTSLELSNKMYQCGIYVPDSLVYAYNRYHFSRNPICRRNRIMRKCAAESIRGCCISQGLKEAARSWWERSSCVWQC